MQHLLDQGVASRRGIMCSHREAPYRREEQPYQLPESERAQDRNIILPLYPQMTEDEQDFVCEVLTAACKQGR
jgi:dTDP-4-amino-4,6-dideoxygalactose transaminase